MGTSQSIDKSQLPAAEYSSDLREYLHQYILIIGGPSVVILFGLMDQIEAEKGSVDDNSEKLQKQITQINEISNLIFEKVKDEFTTFFNSELEPNVNVQQSLIELWRLPDFREEYSKRRFQIDPYLVLPTIFTNLERKKLFNVERDCIFKPSSGRWYHPVSYSRIGDNFPFKKKENLCFDFINHLGADSWGDVIGVSFSLSDYNNTEYLEEFFGWCRRISTFDTYRIVLILTHPDVFNEKFKMGYSYERKVDENIREELKHLNSDHSLIINSIISETFELIKKSQNYNFLNRTYEYYIVNTSHDSDMNELLNCLCIGANVKRKCFITPHFENPQFQIFHRRPNIYSAWKSQKLVDIVIHHSA